MFWILNSLVFKRLIFIYLLIYLPIDNIYLFICMHLFIYLHTHIHLSIYLLHSKKLLFNNLFMAGLKWTQNSL